MIRLREQRRAWLNGVPQSGLFIGGRKVWEAARADDNPLEPFYATDIPLHLDPLKALLHDGLVTSVPNQGGAGVSLNAAVVNSITRMDGFFDISFACMTIPTPIDLNQFRLFVVIGSDYPVNNRQYAGRFAGDGDGGRVNFNWQPGSNRTLIQRWNGASMNQIVANGLTFGTDHVALEMELSAGQFRSWVDGVANTPSNTSWTSLLVDSFFGVANPNPNFIGTGADVIAVRQGADDAIAAVRSYLAGKQWLDDED